MTPEVGIYPNVPYAEYASWPAIRASFLATLSRRSPYHAWYDDSHPSKETDSLRVGRGLHSYILEPATFDTYWAIWQKQDRRTKQGKAAWEAFEAERGTRDWLDSDEFEEIKALAAEVRKQQCIELVCGGAAEVSIVWTDKETGVLCKRRLDYHRNDGWNHYITDLKSTSDAGERAFANDIAGYGYALAAAFSIDGWKALTGEDSLYTLLAVEKDYHIAKVWEPDEQTIAAGRDDYRKALVVAAECLKTGKWEAYGESPSLIRAPAWYLQSHGVSQHNL